jgi:hypothetical protein
MASDRSKKLTAAFGKIEAFLGTPLSQVRDAIFGDAVVLALRASAEGDRRQAGVDAILLVHPKDREMLSRLVHLIDDAQVAGGELARCVERREEGIAYIAREYPAASGRRAEYHADFPDGTFVLSNSEPLIRDVIRRRTRIASGTGEIKELVDHPGFRTVQSKLPETGQAACRLFVDPRLFERISAEIFRPADPSDARALALLGRYASALDYTGAALTWQDGVLAIQTAESIAPNRLDPAILHWARDPRPLDSGLTAVPASAFAIASTGIDLTAFGALFRQLIREEQIPRLESLEVALRGILLGQDLRTRIYPAIGPSLTASFEAPDDSAPLPQSLSEIPYVIAVNLSEPDPAKDPMERPDDAPAVTTAAAVDNALRTTLAIIAIDHKRNRGRNRVVSHDVDGVQVMTLDTPIAFAYAVDRRRHRLVVGNSPRAVTRFIRTADAPDAGSRFRKIRALADSSGDAPTFLALDLQALHELAVRRREQLVDLLAKRRNLPRAETGHDLDQVLALIHLFDSAFITARLEPDASSCVRRIGLIARPNVESDAPSR